jgi:hypothetical protein
MFVNRFLRFGRVGWRVAPAARFFPGDSMPPGRRVWGWLFARAKSHFLFIFRLEKVKTNELA